MSFNVTIETFDEASRTARATLTGELDASVAGQFKEAVDKMVALHPTSVVLLMHKLEFMASAGLRVLIFAKQKLGGDVPLTLVAFQPPVLSTLEMSGFAQGVHLTDSI